jgi:hypothetical protein
MNLDVDFLIDFFNKHSGRPDDDSKDEIGEQEEGGGSTTTSTGGGSVPKWADSYPLNRGKANPLMKSGEKWNTGITRGAANQIW